MGGGCLPYLARYSAANLSLNLGSHLKHCDSGRSCSLHQSPFFLNSAASLALHWPHISSGTPCSAHHQPLWSSPFLLSFVASTTLAGICISVAPLFLAWPLLFSVRLQPP